VLDDIDLPEEHGAIARAVNLHMTGRTVGILRVLVMLWPSRLDRAHVVRNAMTRQAQLVHGRITQQARIGGSVWRVACRAAFGLNGSVFVGKRSLLIRVTLNAGSVRPGSQSCLFQFKTAVRVMAITATHDAF